MSKNKYPSVVTIAGSDPSGGAGIQADIKVISALGCYAASVLTALTAQNTQGVQAIYEISVEFVAQQIDSLFSDLTIAAVKIGMLHNKKIIEVVASQLEKFKPEFIVIDPVMVSKNGCALLQHDTIDFLKQRLFPLATLITPNIHEAEKIIGEKIVSLDDMLKAAENLSDQYGINVLVKGGHLNSSQSSDVLYLKNSKKNVWYHADRIITKNTHGTGCSLSSAIASFLAKGNELEEAVGLAKNYLTLAIKSGSDLQIGKGQGPVDHFYFM